MSILSRAIKAYNIHTSVSMYIIEGVNVRGKFDRLAATINYFLSEFLCF